MNRPHLFKKLGQVPPKEAIEPILKNANKGVWSVRIENGNFRIFQATEAVVLDAFMTSLDNLRSSAAAFGFVDETPGKKEDLQPEVILDDEDGTVYAIAMYDGEVDMDAFQKIVDETWKECDEDLEKTMNILNGPAKRTLITQNCWKERGHILVWPIVGEPLLFKNNKLFEEYGWGWVSNAFRPVEPAATGTSGVPAVKELSAQERILRKQEAKKKLMEGSSPITYTNTKEPPPTDAGTEMVTLGPPPANLNNREKRNWWANQIGEAPPNYKSAIIQVPKSKLKNQNAPKSVVIPDTTKAVAEAAAPDVSFWVFPPEIIKAIQEDFGKIKMASPTELKEFLDKTPSFVEQTKIPLEKWMGADREELRKLCVKYTMQAVSLLQDALVDAQQAREEVDALLAAPAQPKAPDLSKMTAQERIAYKQKQKAAA